MGWRARLESCLASRWAPLAAWIVAAGVAAESAWHYLSQPPGERLFDLHVYVLAERAAAHGASLYGIHGPGLPPFTYPPFAGVVLLPLAAIPEALSRVGWTLLSVVVVCAGAWVIANVLARSRMAVPVEVSRPLIGALALASTPAQSNLRFGQVSMLLLVAVVADVIVLDGRRYQGIATGICAAIKLTPLLFIPYLWLIGRRRAALLAAATFAVATGIGAAAFPSDTRAFWGRLVFHETEGLPVAHGGNQSIYAVAVRAGLRAGPLTGVWIGLSVVVVLAGLWRARGAWRAGQPVLSLAMAGCVSLAVSPISWQHHQGWILLAAAGIFVAGRRLNWLLVAVVALPMLIGFPGFASLGPVGRWVAGNGRTVLEMAVACLLPYRDLTADPNRGDLMEGAGFRERQTAPPPRTSGTPPPPTYLPAAGPAASGPAHPG